MPFRPLPLVLRQAFLPDAIFLIIFNTIFSTPSLHCCPHKTDLPYMVRQALRFALQHRLVFFNILFLPLSAILPSPFRPFCNVFCLCSPRFQQRSFACYFFLPAFVISSAMVFACARCVFHTFICLHLPYFPQRCFSCFSL